MPMNLFSVWSAAWCAQLLRPRADLHHRVLCVWCPETARWQREHFYQLPFDFVLALLGPFVFPLQSVGPAFLFLKPVDAKVS